MFFSKTVVLIELTGQFKNPGTPQCMFFVGKNGFEKGRGLEVPRKDISMAPVGGFGSVASENEFYKPHTGTTKKDRNGRSEKSCIKVDTEVL